MPSPLISIITICFNSEKVIRATLESVLCQTFKDYEYIVVDGNSTDGTVSIIQAYAEKFKAIGIDFRYLSEPDKGIYDAMNKGIDMSTGAWLNFMNSGDGFYNATVLEDVFVKHKVENNIAVVYGSVCLEYSFGNFVLKPLEINTLNKGMAFSHQSCFFKGAVIREWKYDSSFRVSGDHHLIHNLYRQGFLFQEMNICIARFEAENGISNTNSLRSNRECLKISGNLHTIKQQLFFLKPVIRSAFIRLLKKAMIPKKLKHRLLKKRFLYVHRNRLINSENHSINDK